MPIALLSVYDKTGITDLARELERCGWEIWSSGGTARAIRDAGVAVTDVADITGYPPLLGHRVATLHPLIHGGILGDLDDENHVREMGEFGMRPISLVVVNLYPFESDPSVELIDIGGPALVRGAAKNHAHVAVVVRPEDYANVIEEIRSTGHVSPSTRKVLARSAFRATADYDARVADWLADTDESRPDDQRASLPDSIVLKLAKAQSLRYGENPHQSGARYRIEGRSSWWDDAVQHGGKELSYLNVYDADAAWALVHEFAEPACVIVKHANPCGVAVVPGGSIADAYRKANACDPVSAFGGIVSVNRRVTSEMATALADVFTEVVMAPEFEPAALSLLTGKPNLRVISGPRPQGREIDIRSIDGGLLVQSPDDVSRDLAGDEPARPESWRVVTRVQPREDQWSDIFMAWKVVAAVSSNAIVLVREGCALGIGAGQQNRLDSVRIAVERAAGRASGGVCASDAFFPFRDGVDAAASAGVSVIVQPGGSMRDQEAIAAADEHGVAMVFTGQRHFRH